MTVKRMDNIGIGVEDIDAAIDFFTDLGLDLEGRAPVEGDWADGVTGLRGMGVEIAMMRTPDGHSRLELSRFLAPPVVADHRITPVNALGYLRVMFTVEDKTRREARRRSGPVCRHVPALLHPGSRRNSHRACPTARAADFPRESNEPRPLRIKKVRLTRQSRRRRQPMGERHARTEAKLRMLRQGLAACINRRPHLFIRVHLLRVMRRHCSWRQVPKLRGRAGSASPSSG